MKHLRSAEETQRIRSTLAARGYQLSGAAQEDLEALKGAKQTLEAQVAADSELLTQTDAELRHLTQELRSARQQLDAETKAASHLRIRQTITDAFGQILDGSAQVYDEYARRLAQETERLEYFLAEVDEDMEDLEDELLPRNLLLQRLRSAADLDERTVAELADPVALAKPGAEDPEEVIASLLYDLQDEHVQEYVAIEELRHQIAIAASSRAPAEAADQVAEVAAALGAVRSHREALLEERSTAASLTLGLRNGKAELAELHRQLDVMQQELESLLASGTQKRPAILALQAELVDFVQNHVLSLEDGFGPVAAELKDSVLDEYAAFEKTSIEMLIRSDVSPQADGLAPPLVSRLRINSAQSWQKAARALGFHGVSLDYLFQHIGEMAQEVHALPLMLSSGGDDRLAREGNLEKAAKVESRMVEESILPVLEKARISSAAVMSLSDAVELAFREWKSQPGQFCIPDKEQKERFMRRYNYLKVLAHGNNDPYSLVSFLICFFPLTLSHPITPLPYSVRLFEEQKVGFIYSS